MPQLQRRHSRPSRRRRSAPRANGRSVIAFLLVASFGILFAGCGDSDSAEKSADEFAFTEQDVARFRELVMEEQSMGSGSSKPYLLVRDDRDLSEVPMQLDLSQVSTYTAIRGGGSVDAENVYRVTNAFVNMRSAPNVTADQIEQLKQGSTMTVLEFPDAGWAKVRLANGREGYVALRYIAKVTSEEKLAEEKEKFVGKYYVNFGFLNVRKDPDADSEKLGELQGQAIVTPLSLDDVWARIPFNGREGYVAVQYLKPFLPNFLVRQEHYILPVLHYDVRRAGIENLLPQHIAQLQKENSTFLTLRDFGTILVQQQEKDTRVHPRSVVLAISGVTGENLKDVSDILRASRVHATFFVQSNQLGIGGITEQMLLTLIANGNDIQSAGHTGDDLRSLTNSQITLELQQSRQLLEKQTGKNIQAVLYPLGGVNGRVKELVAEAGYLFGVGNNATREFSRSDLLDMPSFAILPTMTPEDVETIALGQKE